MNISSHIKNIILYILILTFISSCHDDELNSFHPRLVEINNILSENPDSIYHLMDMMSINEYNFSERDRMYFYLLKAAAQNKAFIDFEIHSDSIYLPVVNYFLEQPNLYLRMQACYIMGSVYRDLDCRIAAQEWYKKGISMADTTAGAQYLALLARLYGQSAHVCEYLVNSELPSDLYSKGAHYAILAKDTSLYLQYQQALVGCTQKGRPSDSVIAAYEQLIPSLLEQGLHKNGLKGYLQIVLNYMYRIEVDSAKKYIDIYLSESEKYNFDYEKEPMYHTCMASYLGAIGELDSMYTHLLFIANNADWHHRETAYYGLSQYHELYENWDSALYYVRKEYDELKYQFRYTINSQLQESKLVYDVEREKERTQQAEIRTLRVLLVTVSIILLLLVIIIVIYLNRRKLQAKFDTVYQDYVEKSSLLDNVYSSMLQMQDAYEQLKSQISNHGSNKEKTEQQQLAESRIAALRNTKIVRRFLEMYDTKKRPQQEDWDALFETINTVNPRACEFLLLHKSTMIQEDHRMCMLICVGFTPKVMKELLTCTSQKISIQRKRFLEQYFNTEGSAKDFDLLLQTM